MITLTLDWREVLWWMQGGMAGSHVRWSVYEDMVNKVWPQCSEQERKNIWYIMRRDLGMHWRPDRWSGYSNLHGEGDWLPTKDSLAPSASLAPSSYIIDETPWTYFRQVLARFDPENQYAVEIETRTDEELEESLNGLLKSAIISTPTLMVSADRQRYGWKRDKPLVVRAYKWKDPNGKDAYFTSWLNRCNPERIVKVERLEITDTGER